MKEFEAALNVFLLELEFCTDLVDFLMVKCTKLEGVHRQVHVWILQTKSMGGTEEACLEDKFDIETIFHSLKIISWIFDDHSKTLLHPKIVIVDYLKQGTPNSKFLIRRQNEHLRYCQRSFGNFEELLEDRGVCYHLIVKIDKEVEPASVNRYGRCTLNVKLEKSLQLIVVVFERSLHSIDLINLQTFSLQGVNLISLVLHLTFGSLDRL